MKQLAFLLLLIVAGPACAAEWVQIPGLSAYVDMASVRRDTYPKFNEKAPEFVVAWLRGDEDGQTYNLEVAFDCKGRFGIMQQIVGNETKDSRLHSFDMTHDFERYFARTKTIMPDSIYDGAASMVCKGNAPLR